MTNAGNLLQGDRVYLDIVRRSDLEHFYQWSNNVDITYTLWERAVHPIPMSFEKTWYDKIDFTDTNNVRFIIRLKDNAFPIGYCNLKDVDLRNRRAELGIQIGNTDYQNQGYGTEALIILMRYGFQEMNLHRLALTVSHINDRAVHVYRKVGFVDEGIERKSLYRNGEYWNTIHMSMLRAEWIEKYGDAV